MPSLPRRALNRTRDMADHTLARILGTGHHERAWSRKGADEFYWNSRDHPHRRTLLDLVSEFQPSSVLEIGCNSGPNVYLMARRFPEATIEGFDINSGAIEEGKKLLASSGTDNARIFEASFDRLREMADDSVDVIVTDAVLIYAGSDRILELARNMFRVARKGVVLVEYHREGVRPEGEIVPRTGYWVRDYVALFSKMGEASVRTIKIGRDTWDDERWSTYGHFVIVDERPAGR